MKSQRKNLTIRMIPELKQKIHQAAIAEGVSLSDWLEAAAKKRLEVAA